MPSLDPCFSFRRPALLVAGLLVLPALWSCQSRSAKAAAPSPTPPLHILFVTGGGYHDYEKLAPHLTQNLGRLIPAEFEVRFGLAVLGQPGFADRYAAVIYDHCDDEVPDNLLENSLQATRLGKPAVMIHCAVHAFRRSPKIKEWETCCGMRSKVHDPFGPFQVTRVDPQNPITRFFPDSWNTPGDELYQTISIDPDSHPLLRAKSPRDGREHVVAWTYQFGQGRVFATTLGHDLKTAGSTEYLRLLAQGLLWACDKLDAQGQPRPGYSAPVRSSLGQPAPASK